MGLGLDMKWAGVCQILQPQETIGSTGDAPFPFAEGPVLLIEPFQSIPLGEGSKDLETSPAQLFEVGAEAKSKE